MQDRLEPRGGGVFFMEKRDFYIKSAPAMGTIFKQHQQYRPSAAAASERSSRNTNISAERGCDTQLKNAGIKRWRDWIVTALVCYNNMG